VVDLYRLIRLFIVAIGLFNIAFAHSTIIPVDNYCRGGQAGNACGTRDTRQSVYTAWINTDGVRGKCGTGTAFPSASPPATVFVSDQTDTSITFNHSTPDCWGGGSYVNTGGGFIVTWSKVGASCPPPAVLSGSSCVCPAPLVEVGGACESPQPDRAACWNWSLSNSLPGGELVTTQRLQGNIAYDAQFCVPIPPGYDISAGKGCKVTFDKQSAVNFGTDASPNWVSEGEFDFASNGNTVDQSCTLGPGETPKPAPPKEKCPSGFTGTVNGVEVCVNKRPDSGVGDDTKETEENNGTDTKKTKTDSRTECKNGVCTTTTTTTTTTTNNSTGASTTTSNTTVSTQGQKGFCAENPGVKICDTGEDDGSAFGGACGSGFTCEGDAIQCAIAQEQHRRACKLFDDTSEESQLYQSNKGKEGNQTTNLPGNETVNIAGRIDSSDALGSSAAGIADLNVTVLGQSISLPFSMLNPYLAALGNVLLAVSFLLALRIVARG